MYFIISRTSDYEGKQFPCDGAFKKRVKYIDKFEGETIKYPWRGTLDEWKDKGKNNRRILGSETWEHDATEIVWCLRFGNLQALSDFIKNIGEDIVLSVKDNYPGYMFLEIYDGYRE